MNARNTLFCVNLLKNIISEAFPNKPEMIKKRPGATFANRLKSILGLKSDTK